MTDNTRLKLPGFGKSLKEFDTGPEAKYCLHALWDKFQFLSVGVTLREVRMMEFMNQITDKPGWEHKVFDEGIVNKWHEEAMGARSQEMDLDSDIYMSEKMFDYCIQELREKAEEYKDTGLISILDAEVQVVKSDLAIPSSLNDLLKAAVKPLEDVPDHHKDWHPRSNKKVLDLLHPSLFPMVYGTSRVLPYGKVPLRGCAKLSGSGETYALPKEEPPLDRRDPCLMGSTQWLPSDVAWADAGTTKITSYINNLHPDDHPELYSVLEKFVAAAVPLWERCLCMRRVYDQRSPETSHPRIDAISIGDGDFCRPEDEDEFFMWENEFERREWMNSHWTLTWPEPKGYAPFGIRPTEEQRNLQAKFFPDGLQVIFKLANIHLTPSNPKYEGGSLHIEGALNDRIVATALYYYDCDNITKSELTLYHSVNTDMLRRSTPRNQHNAIERWLGISNFEPGLQWLGSVVTREGRFIAFPNVLAHQVEPFELTDNSRPGHRKILAMFLVDPNFRVLSTSVVPPQRKDWWAREVRDISPFNQLPTEIFDMIIGFVVDFLMSWEDALVTREILMKERSWIDTEFDYMAVENKFNFCEH
ncbi:hypothetical protein EKO27_g614 [Xylaria grammica]|uniref:Uncharacterized protein n=1 Tax=Xylaria grammica TaxID=363999 RepID=A0A439DJF5_9PEZI|nr:hypothetical protein EKO27_g614 [Xylaria grammica]